MPHAVRLNIGRFFLDTGRLMSFNLSESLHLMISHLLIARVLIYLKSNNYISDRDTSLIHHLSLELHLATVSLRGEQQFPFYQFKTPILPLS